MQSDLKAQGRNLRKPDMESIFCDRESLAPALVFRMPGTRKVTEVSLILLDNGLKHKRDRLRMECQSEPRWSIFGTQDPERNYRTHDAGKAPGLSPPQATSEQGTF